jgi:hypothetical protein
MMFWKNKTLFFILGFGLFGLGGVFLRFLDITQNTFFFFDEGYYLNFNRPVLSLIHQHPPQDFQSFLSAFYLLIRHCLGTGKALWFLIVDARVFWGWLDFWAFPRVVSALAGSVTLVMTYVFARKFFDSKAVGVLSLMILAVLPGHVFYSRLAIQESLCCLFFLLGFYFYVFPKKFGVRTFLSSLFFVGVYFTNYRMIIAPAFVALAELLIWITGTETVRQSSRKYVWHTLTFLACVVLIGNLDQAQNTIVTFSWMFHQSNLAKEAVDWFNWLSYPYYIFHLEGILFGLVFFFGFYLLFAKKWSRTFPLLLVMAMMAVFSLTQDKGARYLAVGLPFIAMTVADNIVCAYRTFPHKVARGFIGILTAVMIVTLIPKSWSIARATSHYEVSVHMMRFMDRDAKMLSSQRWVQSLYGLGPFDVMDVPKSLSHLIKLYKNGYRYLVLDPQAFISYTNSGRKFDPPLKGYLGFVWNNVPPDKTFEHFSDMILERFVFEHNENLRRSITFLKINEGQYNSLRIYDIQKCLAVLRSRLTPQNTE